MNVYFKESIIVMIYLETVKQENEDNDNLVCFIKKDFNAQICYFLTVFFF